MGEKKSSAHKLSVFVLAMITFAAIASLRGLPSMAEYGLSSAFYFLLISVLFFIPVSLVSAELATGWPKKGGVYLWVKEAFGQRWGFLAIWLQWIQNVIWYPTVLSFAAGALAFIINPSLIDNKIYVLAVILGVYWGSVITNLRGMKMSGTVSSVGAIGGTILPGLLIVVLGGYWLLSGNPSQIPLDLGDFVPDIGNLSTIVLAATVLLSFGGIEMSAVHAKEVKDPQRDYPKAIFIALGLTVVIFTLATLAIAIVVPQSGISLVAGVMQAFSDFFNAYNIAWMIPIVAFLIVVGAVGQVSTWIVGPSKGLLATAEDGTLPPFFQKVNANGMPVNIMLVQGAIVTVLALVFLLMPSVSSSYWILTALTAQLYLIMYVVMFLSAIKLRYSQPGVKRTYTVPGGMPGIWVIAGLGALAALAGILLGFIPPSQLQTGNELFYDGFLVAGIIVMGSAPLIIHHLRKPEWAPKKVK